MNDHARTASTRSACPSPRSARRPATASRSRSPASRTSAARRGLIGRPPRCLHRSSRTRSDADGRREGPVAGGDPAVAHDDAATTCSKAAKGLPTRRARRRRPTSTTWRSTRRRASACSARPTRRSGARRQAERQVQGQRPLTRSPGSGSRPARYRSAHDATPTARLLRGQMPRSSARPARTSGTCSAAEEPGRHDLAFRQGRDEREAGLRHDHGRTIVTMNFTGTGRGSSRRSPRRSRTAASRSRSSRPEHSDSNVEQSFSQHFAVILDNKLESFPLIDFTQNPNGIYGRQRAPRSRASARCGEAKRIALVLQSGSLPVDVRRRLAVEQVSATLGKDSLRQGLIAGIARPDRW